MNTAGQIVRRPEAVLYVDDEEMARKYFGHAVGSEYEVLTASDADSAIEILRSQPGRIGILVSDYRMPGRGGGDLLREVAREFPQVVRIMVTAYAERDVLLDAVNSGEVFRILEKPMDVGEMLSILHLASDQFRVRSERRQRLMAMDETLAFLAHELNTPLAAIVNFAQGVEKRAGGEGITAQQQAGIGDAARAVDDNAQYCLALLASFTESVKRAGALSGQCAGGTTARQMIEALLDTYPLALEQRAAIEFESEEDFPIDALPDCVTLVLSSILGNALRVLEGRIDARIRFVVSAANGPQIRIVDNGPGIPPSVMSHLMNDPVTTRENGGSSGWGMIFCKRIMQAIGGSIQVHSVPDEHTAVTLNFPAAGTRRNTP